MGLPRLFQHAGRAFWGAGRTIIIFSVGLCLSDSKDVEADSSLCPTGRHLVAAKRVPDTSCCQVSEYCKADSTQQSESFMLFSARHCSLTGQLEGDCDTSRQGFLFSTSSKQLLVPNPALPHASWLTTSSADSVANLRARLDKLRGDKTLKQKYIFAYEPLLRSGPWIIEIVRSSYQSRRLEANVFFGDAPGLGTRTNLPPRTITYDVFGRFENCISPKNNLLFTIVKPAYLSGDECILIAQNEIERECSKLERLAGYRRQILQQTGACKNTQGAIDQ